MARNACKPGLFWNRHVNKCMAGTKNEPGPEIILLLN